MTSKQYDSIQSEYDEWRECIDAYIEKENVRQSVADVIKGANVLELACGSGFYTYDLLDWGARAVVAVDISEEMVSAARNRREYERSKDRLQLLVADASRPQTFPASPFDVVIAAWLLTYAPDKDTLSKMFKTAAINLRPGGVFVTTVIRPSSDPASSFIDGHVSFWSPQNYRIEVLQKVADGVAIRCHAAKSRGRRTHWDSFYLRQEAYESATKKAGLTGPLVYEEPLVPPEITSANPSPEMTALVQGATSLHFNVLKVWK